jgi:hypothetical protein
MRETRRGFLASLAVLGCFAAGNGWLTAQEKRNGMPSPPPPAEPPNQEADTQRPDPRAAKRMLLLQNEKEFRAGVERLYQLTGELRDEVGNTPTTDVLSVRMYKKTEEIEKLAKRLKARAKGS